VGLRQVDLAEKMGVYQSWVTHMESGQRRIDVIELIELGKALKFDPIEFLTKLLRRRAGSLTEREPHATEQRSSFSLTPE